jgi:hypothetical protein
LLTVCGTIALPCPPQEIKLITWAGAIAGVRKKMLMEYHWLVILILVPLLVCGILYWLIKSGGRRTEKELRKKYGARLKTISGCGVISGYNRTPGLLACLDDRLVYKALITGQAGEIPFEDVAAYALENTRYTRHRRARKYLGAEVLSFDLKQGRVPLFVLSSEKAGEWRQMLSSCLSDSAVNPSV